jgi:hypothetical protein
MKKTLILILLTIISLPTALFSKEIDCKNTEGFTGFGVVNTYALNVRDGFDKTKDKIVDTYPKGTPVAITNCTDSGWISVGDGRWVSRNINPDTNQRFVTPISKEEAFRIGLQILDSAVDPDCDDDVSSTTSTLKVDPKPEVRGGSDYYCPVGFKIKYLKDEDTPNSPKMCVSLDDQYALGPFTPSMIELCRFSGNGDKCFKFKWDFDLVLAMRGDDPCPRGAKNYAKQSACVDDTYSYGPFTYDQIKECIRRTGKEIDCHSQKWDRNMFVESSSKPRPTPKPTPKPTPRPTPKPTPRPTPKPTPAPKRFPNLTSDIVRASWVQGGGRTKGPGYCYTGVWKALKSATGITESIGDKIGVPVEHAYQFGIWANNNPKYLAKYLGYKRIYPSSGRSAPTGSILVYNKRQCGANPDSGHIEIKVNSTTACSDYCAPIRSCRPIVYAPIK